MRCPCCHWSRSSNHPAKLDITQDIDHPTSVRVVATRTMTTRPKPGRCNMSRKIAIILRGPMGGGKSTVTSGLQELYSLPKNSHVELDQFWGEGEKRHAGSCRYWDLRDRTD